MTVAKDLYVLSWVRSARDLGSWLDLARRVELRVTGAVGVDGVESIILEFSSDASRWWIAAIMCAKFRW